jgi:cellulose synthase/poly-beta-1,6-N-acetylglucosamine synthase-like glycosyltransferase
MIAFLVAAAAAAYILVGWPLLLAVLSRLRRKEVLKRFEPLTVSVIIPAYNGESYIGRKLESVLALDYPRERMQIIVVSDGSTDQTAEIVESYVVEAMRLPRGGKCAALNAAIPKATGEILLLTDVRQEIDPQSLRHMVSCFAEPKVGVVSGELRIRQGATMDARDVGLYWRFETWIRNRLSDLDSMFGATGPFYCLRRSLAVPIPSDILLDDMYLPLAAFFRGYRCIVEVRAVAWDVPTSVATEFIRKVRTLAGNYQLLKYYPQLLSPFGNRMWLHYISYKLGRLLLPWFVIAMAISTFFLPAPWRLIALVLQATAYTFALLDPFMPQGNPLKRVMSPVRTFLTMMVAAIFALKVWFVDPRSLWVVTSTKKGNQL